MAGVPRPEWDNDFIIAVEVYRETIHLSGFDMNGCPQLTKLETVMDFMDYEVENKQRFYFYLSAIHNSFKAESRVK